MSGDEDIPRVIRRSQVSNRGTHNSEMDVGCNAQSAEVTIAVTNPTPSSRTILT